MIQFPFGRSLIELSLSIAREIVGARRHKIPAEIDRFVEIADTPLRIAHLVAKKGTRN